MLDWQTKRMTAATNVTNMQCPKPRAGSGLQGRRHVQAIVSNRLGPRI